MNCRELMEKNPFHVPFPNLNHAMIEKSDSWRHQFGRAVKLRQRGQSSVAGLLGGHRKKIWNETNLLWCKESVRIYIYIYIYCIFFPKKLPNSPMLGQSFYPKMDGEKIDRTARVQDTPAAEPLVRRCSAEEVIEHVLGVLQTGLFQSDELWSISTKLDKSTQNQNHKKNLWVLRRWFCEPGVGPSPQSNLNSLNHLRFEETGLLKASSWKDQQKFPCWSCERKESLLDFICFHASSQVTRCFSWSMIKWMWSRRLTIASGGLGIQKQTSFESKMHGVDPSEICACKKHQEDSRNYGYSKIGFGFGVRKQALGDHALCLGAGSSLDRMFRPSVVGLIRPLMRPFSAVARARPLAEISGDHGRCQQAADGGWNFDPFCFVAKHFLPLIESYTSLFGFSMLLQATVISS